MTIAELFIKLGFKFDGKEDLDKSVDQLESAATKSIKAAAGVDLMAWALVALVKTAVNAAVSLNKFALATGLSRTELQQWEHTAALGNVSAQELQQTIKGIQTARNQIALGQGNTSPWVLLGINPHSDPFQILRQLHTELMGVNQQRRGMARVIAQQAGISENMFQLLSQKNLPIDALKQMYLLTDDNQTSLLRLNIAWNNLLDTSDRVKNRFGAELAGAFEVFVGWLQKGVDLFAKFVDWLDKGSFGADLVKVSIATLAVALVALAGAMTAVATGLGIATSAIIAFQIAAAAPLLTISAIAAAAFLAADAIALLTGKYSEMNAEAKKAKGELQNSGALPHSLEMNHSYKDFVNSPATPAEYSNGNKITTNTVNIAVNGAGNPHDVGQAVADKLSKQLGVTTWTRGATNL